MGKTKIHILNIRYKKKVFNFVKQTHETYPGFLFPKTLC